jgi:hypothetical protein
MPYFTYDTSVIISKSLIIYTDKASNFVMSSVVLLELMASASDDSSRKLIERLFRDYAHDNSLIVPNEDDCLQAKFCIGLLKTGEELAEAGCRDLLRESLSV